MSGQEVVLRNAHGVEIRETPKCGPHYCAANATCQCGEELLVAPPICHPAHEKGNPVMVCGDHLTHAYRFSELRLGRQPMGSAQQ